jgi:large subunit ribosomal protein L10
MPNAQILAEKQQFVGEIAQKLQTSTCTIVADYRGLTVAQLTELRGQLREVHVELHVVKNSLVRRAVANSPVVALERVLVGPSIIAFGADAIAPAKTLLAFAKRNDKLKIKGGIVEGRVVDDVQIKALADLPSREGLLSMLLSVLQAPMRNFALAVKAVAEQKEQQ